MEKSVTEALSCLSFIFALVRNSEKLIQIQLTVYDVSLMNWNSSISNAKDASCFSELHIKEKAVLECGSARDGVHYCGGCSTSQRWTILKCRDVVDSSLIFTESSLIFTDYVSSSLVMNFHQRLEVRRFSWCGHLRTAMLERSFNFLVAWFTCLLS